MNMVWQKNLDLNLHSMINNHQFQMSANNFHILTLSSNFHVVKKYIAVLSDTGASSISTPFKRKQRLLFLLSSNFSNIHCIRAYQNRSNFDYHSVWKILSYFIKQDWYFSSGQLYCEDCYGRYLAPDCSKCRKKIIGVRTIKFLIPIVLSKGVFSPWEICVCKIFLSIAWCIHFLSMGWECASNFCPYRCSYT